MKNNKLAFLLILTLSSFVVSSCNPKENTSNSSEDNEQQSHFEQALSSISRYDIHSTNGFDFDIKQFYDFEVINSNSVQLRVKFDVGTQAKKVQINKRLNTYGQGEQFSTTEVVSYFRDDQICENLENGWTWRAYEESDYLRTGLSSYNFNINYFVNVTETINQTDLQFLADVPLNYVSSVLGDEAVGINQLKIKLIVNEDYSLLKSLSFTYNQEKTNSEISFVSIFDAGSIVFPN